MSVLTKRGTGENEMNEDIAVLDAHISALMEHFDCVQIFVTRNGGEAGTVHVSRGRGDWYARYGVVRQWVVKEEKGMES